MERLVRAVPNNSGRTLIEIFSGEAFMARAENSEITGPGFIELENAKKTRKICYSSYWAFWKL